ncbi:MAG: hypothetical protein HWN80_17480, partial [Candidatus Lokiarchaeota archaeon]|nr:hypothetical protein [Candidatus Lokiarchaeota archaeon]
VTIMFYANDSANNVAFDSVVVNKDTGLPIVSITYPTGGDYFDATAPDYVVEISDSGSPIDTMWYTIDGGATNITFTLNGTIDQNNWTALVDGPVTIMFYANDSANNVAFDSVVVNKDTALPIVSITYPTGGEYYGATAPSFTVEITDGSLDTMWYTIDGGATNITFTINGTIDQNNWTALADGPITIFFYANDSANNVAFDSVVVNKDTGLPMVSITYPTGGEYFDATAPDYVVEISDSGSPIDTMWYTIDGGATNITFTINGTIDQNNWTALADGPITIFFYANDSANNVAFDSVVVNKDTGNPTVSITSPTGGEYFDATAPDYVVEISDSGSPIDTMWYTIDGGANIEFTVNGTIDQNNWTALTDGPVTILFYANDSAGNINNTSSITLYKDVVIPSLSIDSPANNTYWNIHPNIQVTATDPNLHSVWYTVGATKILLDSGVSEPFNSSIWNSLPDECQFTINFYANDSAGNINNTFSITLYKDIVIPSLSIDSPINNTYWNTIPDIQVTASDTYLDLVWYTVGATKILLDSGVSEPFNSSIWNSLPDECQFTINFYANDSAGNINNTYSFTLYKDVLPPRLIVNLPINNTYCDAPPLINITAFDMTSPLNWFNYMVETTQILLTNNTEQALDIDIWSSLDQGVFEIYIYAWDSLNNLNDTYVITLYKDTLAPEITINSPEDLTFVNSRPRINITAIDPNLDTLWYRVGTTNIMLSSDIEVFLNGSIWDGLAEGPFNIEIFANDTFGHINNSYVLTLYKDIITPSLIVILPINGTLYNSQPSINVTVFDTYFDTLWYRVGNTNITLTNNTEVLLNLTIWNSLPDEGAFLIYFYANDSVGNLNNTFVLTLYKDIKAPTIIIDSPQSNDLFGETPPSVSLNVTDANLDEVWYQLSNGTVTTNNYTWTGFIDQTVWNQVGNGTVTIKFYANDTFNHLGFAEVTVRKNILNPIITIENPQENELFGIIAPNFTIYKSGTELNTTWYTIDYGVTNYTFFGLNVVINQTAWDNYGFEDVFITFYINDSLGKIGFDEITIRKDPDPPEVTITFIDPLSNYSYCTVEPKFIITAYDPNLVTIWYRVGSTNITIFNDPVLDLNNTVITLNDTIWNGLSQGIFAIEVFAEDELGYLNDSITLTFYKDTLAPMLIINQPYDGNYYNTPPPINITVYEPNPSYPVCTYTVTGYSPPNNVLANNTEVTLNQDIWIILPEGEFEIQFTSFDIFGHRTDLKITLYKDTIAPTVVVNLPIDNSYWNTPPIINIAAIDPNLNTTWYRVGTTNITLTNSTDKTLDDAIWGNLTEGSFILEVFANDSYGNLNNLFTLTLYKDTLAPEIIINSPDNNTYYGSEPEMYLIATDLSVYSVWYSVGGTIRPLTNDVSEPLDSDIWNSLPQGEFQVFIFANDSAGNLNNTLILTLFKDTLPPLVTVNLPYNNTYWNSRPTINVEGFDPNLDEISYLVAGYEVIIENGNDTTLSNYIWQTLLIGDGPFIMEIFAKDIFGYTNDSIQLMLYKDMTSPIIDINSPQPNDLFGENTPFVSLDVTDTNLEDVWYQLSNGTVVTNNFTWTGSIEQVVWDQVGNGTVTIRFYANDTATNKNYEEVVVRKNIYAPIVSINSPLNNELWGIDSPNFEIYTSGTDLGSYTWYMLVGVSINFTFTGDTGVINQTAWDYFDFGTVTMRFYINNSFGKIGFDEVSIRKDPDMPIITIHSPIDHTAFASPPFINLTIDEPNLDKVWYRINNNIIDITDNLTQFIDLFIWNSLTQGDFNVELFANDTMGNVNNLTTLNLSKDINGPTIFINLPVENEKVGRTAPYFELLIFDENGVGTRWYTIGLGDNTRQFTGLIGRINQTLWEQNWDNLAQGDIITITFYARDTLGNENFTVLNLIVDKPIDLPKFLSDPLGLLLPTVGLVAMIPITIKLTKSTYYKSLNNKNKKKLRNVLISAGFFLSLLTLYFIF